MKRKFGYIANWRRAKRQRFSVGDGLHSRNVHSRKEYLGFGFRYGNWCGANWSAGKAQASVIDDSVPAIDSKDQICKDHDYDYATPGSDLLAADIKFVKRMSKEPGALAVIMTSAVGAQAGIRYVTGITRNDNWQINAPPSPAQKIIGRKRSYSNPEATRRVLFRTDKIQKKGYNFRVKKLWKRRKYKRHATKATLFTSV